MPDHLAPITSAMSRHLLSLRRKVPGRCVVCGKRWRKSYTTRRTCSGACRSKLSYRRGRAIAPSP